MSSPSSSSSSTAAGIHLCEDSDRVKALSEENVIKYFGLTPLSSEFVDREWDGVDFDPRRFRGYEASDDRMRAWMLDVIASWRLAEFAVLPDAERVCDSDYMRVAVHGVLNALVLDAKNRDVDHSDDDDDADSRSCICNEPQERFAFIGISHLRGSCAGESCGRCVLDLTVVRESTFEDDCTAWFTTPKNRFLIRLCERSGCLLLTACVNQVMMSTLANRHRLVQCAEQEWCDRVKELNKLSHLLDPLNQIVNAYCGMDRVVDALRALTAVPSFADRVLGDGTVVPERLRRIRAFKNISAQVSKGIVPPPGFDRHIREVAATAAVVANTAYSVSGEKRDVWQAARLTAHGFEEAAAAFDTADVAAGEANVESEAAHGAATAVAAFMRKTERAAVDNGKNAAKRRKVQASPS